MFSGSASCPPYAYSAASRAGSGVSADRVLVWAHWLWFLVPHGTLVYIMLRHPSRFDRSAVLTYAVFDIGAMVYWILPTAPPWYAAAAGRGRDFNGRLIPVRRPQTVVATMSL